MAATPGGSWPGPKVADQAPPGGLLVEFGDVLRRELTGHLRVHLVLLDVSLTIASRTSMRLRRHPTHWDDEVLRAGQRLI
jgi:hypothetical protein